MTQLTEVQAAYLAGLFDGEGCITVDTTKDRLIISIGGNDPRVAGAFKEVFGGSVLTQENPNRQHFGFKWRAAGKRAGAILSILEPHLKVKKSQARLGVAVAGLTGLPGKHLSPLHSGWKPLRVRILRKIQYLNQHPPKWVKC